MVVITYISSVLEKFIVDCLIIDFILKYVFRERKTEKRKVFGGSQSLKVEIRERNIFFPQNFKYLL